MKNYKWVWLNWKKNYFAHFGTLYEWNHTEYILLCLASYIQSLWDFIKRLWIAVICSFSFLCCIHGNISFDQLVKLPILFFFFSCGRNTHDMKFTIWERYLVLLQCCAIITPSSLRKGNLIPLSSHNPFPLLPSLREMLICFLSLWICLFQTFEIYTHTICRFLCLTSFA